MNKNFLYLVVLIVAVVLSACSEESSNADKTSDDSNDAEITIKLGHTGNDLEDDPYHHYTEKFSEVLEEESDGKIELEVFPNAQLGDLTSMMEQVDEGDLEMTAGQNSGTLATYDPNIQVLDLPYAFDDLEVGQEVLEGEFGNKIKDGISENSNLKIMSFLPSSFRHFGNNDGPITSPSDLEGKTVRTMEIPVYGEMVKALGGSPQDIPFEELYSAVQTGVVDAHEQAPYTLLMSKLEEVTDYFSLDKHTMNIAVTLTNEEFFYSLSEEDQEIIEKADTEARQALLDYVADNAEQNIEDMEEAGVEVNELTDEEFEKFQDVVIEPVTEYLEKTIDEGLVDEMLEDIDDKS